MTDPDLAPDLRCSPRAPWRFARDDERVFGPLDFGCAPGEALLVEGDNGAGKTTLLRVLAGLLPADRRRDANGAGEPIDRSTPRCRAHRAARAPARAQGRPERRARTCASASALHGRASGITPGAALRIVGLAGYEDVPARTLSAGQSKRPRWRALRLSPAPLWLLDEPYANLDLDGIELVNRMVQAHRCAAARRC